MPYTVDRGRYPLETVNAKRSRASSRANSTEPLSHCPTSLLIPRPRWKPLVDRRITEIAAVVVRNGEIVEVFETGKSKAIDPLLRQRITNITWDMVKMRRR